MADEAVIIELLGEPRGCPIQFNCVDADAWLKGALMRLSDNREVDTSASAVVCAGVLAAEKVTLDGSTTVTCWTNGIFDLKATAAGITVGFGVQLGGANQIKAEAAGDAEKGLIFGHALATFGASETQSVRVLI